MTPRFLLLTVACFATVCTGYRRLFNDVTNDHYTGNTYVEPNITQVLDKSDRKLSDLSSVNHLVKNLPGLDSSIVHYAGHITIDTVKSSNIFYWLFEAPSDAESLPLLIWMNGGPGCSSMDGLWLELGPLYLNSNGDTVSLNPFSWHNAANLLFIDQPVGTGFAFTKSKAGYASNDDMINNHFYTFLSEFFALHPRYVTTGKDGKRATRPLFMSGESHAGHYIPTMALHIIQKNALVRPGSEDLFISLEGIALGNPWLDPYYQYDASDFAHGQGLINMGQKHRLKELERKCQTMLNSGKYNNPACFSLLDKIVDSSTVAGSDRVLMYDTRKFVRQTSSFPPGHEALERYLNRADVKEAIHVTGSPNKFEECANPPYYALSHQDGKGVTRELTRLLDAGLRVLVFAGQYDLICNHIGIEKVLRALPWKHQKDWLLAQPGVWAAEGKPIGFSRAFENLDFLIVLDAGHMVPMDQPRIALDMISSFLQNKPFGKVVSKLAVSLSGSEDATISRCPRFPSDDASATSGSSSAGASSAAPSTGLGGIMNSLWPSSSAGAGGGGTASSEKKMRGGPRKGRGRRGFAVSTPQAQVSDSSLGQQRDRQLLEESSSPPFTLSIGHATPLNGSVLLHLRLTQTGAAYHQHQALHEGASNALLSQQHFEIRVDPGQREVLVDVVELARRKFSTDIVIDNLRDGTEYAFSTWWQDGRGNKQLMSKRSVLVKPGCFHPSMIQCCGRGECVPSSSGGEDHGGGVSSGDTYCKCDSGYTGPLCSSYAVSTTGVSNAAKQITDAGVSCPAHTLHHAHILNSTSFHVGLLLQPRGSQSWAAPSMFQTKYRDIVSAALQQDIIGIISLGTTGGSTRVSVESSTGAPLQVLPGETAVVNRSSHSSSSPSSVGHHSVHTHAHHVHPSSKEAVAAADAHSHTVHVSIKLCGLNTEVDAEVRRLLQQLTDSSSALRSGLVSSHLKANYVVVVAHTASSTASSPTTARSIGAAPGDVDGDTGDEKSSYIWFSFLGLLIVSCAFGVKGIWHASSRR